MNFLDELAARRRFGMKPGLEAIRTVLAALGDPQRTFRAIHVAGTNGKGATCAILDACLGDAGRYTSPHLVRLNERFFLRGRPLDDATLEAAAAKVRDAIAACGRELTFFEALTAVAFLVYAETRPAHVILETGLGGRLDATNVCESELCVITRIGLDHCDWLGDTVEKIAAEKAGIVKPGVPVVLGRNVPGVREVVEARAREVGAPFHYAPDLVDESEIPDDFSLGGAFNRENAVTALAAMKVRAGDVRAPLAKATLAGFGRVAWPGRFQRVGRYLVDGAHNPPAARALVGALRAEAAAPRYDLVAGFCGDKDVDEVLRILAPVVRRAWAVKTGNPRSLEAGEVARKMSDAGMSATACASLGAALASAGTGPGGGGTVPVLVCGSLFLAGEALVELGACPGPTDRIDPSESLRGRI